MEISLRIRCLIHYRKKKKATHCREAVSPLSGSGVGYLEKTEGACCILGSPSTLQVAPELPGALEVVLRSSFSAEVKAETKFQEAYLGLMGLWEGSQRRSQIWGYLHMKCHGVIGNSHCVYLGGEHMLFPMWRRDTSAMSVPQPNPLQRSPNDTMKGHYSQEGHLIHTDHCGLYRVSFHWKL